MPNIEQVTPQQLLHKMCLRVFYNDMRNIISLSQDSTTDPTLINLSPEPSALTQPAVIAATIQPAVSATTESWWQSTKPSTLAPQNPNTIRVCMLFKKLQIA